MEYIKYIEYRDYKEVYREYIESIEYVEYIATAPFYPKGNGDGLNHMTSIWSIQTTSSIRSTQGE